MGVMPQTDPSNRKKGNRKKIKPRKVTKSKRRGGQRDRYQKLPQECVLRIDTRTVIKIGL